MNPQLDVLYEDNHILVLNKPPQLATMGVDQRTSSLLQLAKEYIRHRYNKPGNVYLGVVSRLDSFTSGVVVFARTSKAAGRLSGQFLNRQVQKFYLCATPAMPRSQFIEDLQPWLGPFPHRWEDWVWHDDQARRMRSLGTVGEQKDPVGAKRAELEWRPLRRTAQGQINLVRLLTGRKHQIRVQFSSRDMAIVGDRKYDSSLAFPHGIALHAWLLGFPHPVKDQMMHFSASLPASWNRLGNPPGDVSKSDCTEYFARLAQTWNSQNQVE